MAKKRAGLALVGAVGCLAATLGTGGGAPASAAGVTVLADHLVLPLGVSVAKDGSAYVAQTGAEVVTRVSPDGQRADVLTDKTDGVSSAVPLGDGSIVYNYSIRAGQKNPVGQVRRQFKAGTAGGNNVVVGFLGRHEWATNPDAGASYGWQGLPAGCDAPGFDGHPASYDGVVDTHPYSLARLSDGSFAVADAGANAILRVQDKQVSTIAVLPGVPVTITSDLQAQHQLPACTVGATYVFESVPTDVQQGPDGMLYASSLAGGFGEDAVGNGGVFRVDPATGQVTRLAGGLASATGIAVSQSGTVYVTQLFAGQVSVLDGGTVKPLVSLPLPGAIAVRGGKLYVTTNVLPAPGSAPDGMLVRIDLP